MLVMLVSLGILIFVLIAGFLLKRHLHRKSPGIQNSIIEIDEHDLEESGEKLVPVDLGTKGEKGKELQPVSEGDIFVETSYFKEVVFELEEGEIVAGQVEEIGRGSFNLYIMDEKNFLKFSKGEKYMPERADIDVSSDYVEFKAPRSGIWYFVFELNRKRHERVINIKLEKRGHLENPGT